MKISELIDGIRTQSAVLPEFQREYVWSKDQAKSLVVSLTQGYPVGSLLFWKTNDPPDLKNIDTLPEMLGTIQVILDGQQRLTTLYMLTTGDIPPYYKDQDIQSDPRDLYFNVRTGEFLYYQVSRMRDSPVWLSVVDCFNKKTPIFEIARKQTETDGDALEMADLLNENLNRLRNIREADLPVQTVPISATLHDAINIFDLVNSKGTKLTDAELALTHVTGTWSDARRNMKRKMDELNPKNFYFDLTFMTRALTGATVQRALFETIHDRTREELEEGWKNLTKILDYLVTVLPQGAFIHSTEDLNTTNVLIPLVVYLSLRDCRFPTEKTFKNAVHWLYAAHTWARYTAQTDQRLENDVSLVVRLESPWDSLRDQIVDQRGRIDVKASDLHGRGIQHPLYRMTFTLVKAHGAVDWFNGAPLGTTHGKSYRIHNHHIFPCLGSIR